MSKRRLKLRYVYINLPEFKQRISFFVGCVWSCPVATLEALCSEITPSTLGGHMGCEGSNHG